MTAPSWLKTNVKENKDTKWNYEGWQNGDNKVDLTPPPLINPVSSRKQLNSSSVTQGIDNTPLPKKSFWENIRANENKITNNPVFKAVTALPNKLYEIPFTQRLITKAGEAVAGPGAYKNYDGSVMQPKDTGSKLGNLAGDFIGTGIGFSMPMSGLGNKGLQGAANDIAQPLLNKLPAATSKLGQYGANALKTGLEFGGLNTVQGLSQGQSVGDSLKSGAEGILQGALFGTALKGAGDLGKSAFPKWKTSFEDGLKPKINDNSSQGLNMNLQQFKTGKEQIKKTSKFYSNSLKETQMLPDEVKSLLNESDFTYGVKTNQGELNKAQQRINVRGQQAEMDRLRKSTSYDNAEDTMAHLLITRNLRKEAEQSGDYTKVVDWLKDTRKKTTNTAQALQAVSAWKKTTPEGALIKATSVVDEVQNDLKKNNPKLMDKVDAETKGVKDAIEEAKKQAAKEIEKKLPEEMLASKVSSTIKEPKAKKTNLVQDMVNELFKVAKESPLPEKAAAAKRSPLEYLQSAIQNKGQYGDVWEKAKVLVKGKYKDDAEASQILEDYFSKGIIPQYSNSTVNDSIKASIKDLGNTLDNIARTSKGDKEAFLSDLTAYINKSTGASGEDASILANKIKEQYDSLVKDKSKSIVKQMFKDVPQSQRKTIEQKITELVNLGAFEESSLRDLVSQKYGVPTLSSDDAKFITETMTKAQGMKEGYNKNAEIAKVMQLIANKVPATASEKLQAYLRISMLANAKTLLTRNPLGNVGLGIAENIKDIPASLIDKAVSLKTGQRTTIAPSLKGLKEQGKGLVQGSKEWNMDRKQGIDTSPSRGQYELPNKKIFHNKVLNAVDQFTRRSLGLGDRPFYQAAYNDRLRQLQVINKTKDISENMIEDATNYALDRTLQNNSNLSKGAGMIKKGLNLNKEFGLGSIAMPFTTTPANVLDKALDYSPIGTFKAAAEWGKFIKTGALDQKKLVDELGRSITGTSAIVLGWELAKNGLATGKASTNERERELNKATGVNDYSFKIGDKYKTFDWAQPMSLPLAMGIDMYNAKKNKADLKTALTSAGDTVFKQSFLQGISRMFGGYSPTDGIVKTVSGSYTQAIPSTLRQATQLADPFQRETYSDNPKEQTINTLKSKVPFLSKTLPAKVDVLGNEVKQFGGKNNPFNVLINPGYSNTDTNTKGTTMVKQIVEATNNKDILPKVAQDTITYVSEVKNAGTKNRTEVKTTIKLTPKELSQFKKYIGQETLKTYNEKADSNSFNELSAKDKAKELESLLRKIYDKGEEEILKGRKITSY